MRTEKSEWWPLKFKAQLGEHFPRNLDNISFSFFLCGKPALKSPIAALTSAKPALRTQTGQIKAGT